LERKEIFRVARLFNGGQNTSAGVFVVFITVQSMAARAEIIPPKPAAQALPFINQGCPSPPRKTQKRALLVDKKLEKGDEVLSVRI